MSATFRPFAWPLVALALFAGVCANASADKKTACTITVNSADEKEAFRRSLPKGQWEFVELVERGRHDWLESACRTGVRCDVLIISGHYDGGNEFFSDQIEAREFLPVDEMERVSCSDSCPGLFSQLKEVYLFGCNTLNPQANASPSAEIGRSLQGSDVRERFTALGMEAIGGTAEEFGAFMRAETAKWAQVIKSANIKIE